MSAMTILSYDTGKWGVIIPGHCIPLHIVAEHMETEFGREIAHETWDITEQRLVLVPRVKWCSRHAFGSGSSCDLEGEWHSHWFSVQPSADETTKFTVVYAHAASA